MTHSYQFSRPRNRPTNRSQAHRDEPMNGFSVGRYRVLVATDIAARGIELVVNYDLPANGEDFFRTWGVWK